MFKRFLARWADSAARSRVLELQTELERVRAKLSVVEIERDTLAAVAARERIRVAAETAALQRTVVGAQK